MDLSCCSLSSMRIWSRGRLRRQGSSSLREVVMEVSFHGRLENRWALTSCVARHGGHPCRVWTTDWLFLEASANSGITEDQRLMVRTMLQGNMTFERVGEELIAQHPRIHEKERRHGRSFGGKQSSWRKGGGKSSGYRSYWGEADAWDGSDADWENGSQSLSGYTAEYVQESWDDGNYENDSYAAIEYNDASEYDDTFAEDYVGYFVEWGLDFEDEEACALAAETIQLGTWSLQCQAPGEGQGAFSIWKPPQLWGFWIIVVSWATSQASTTQGSHWVSALWTTRTLVRRCSMPQRTAQIWKWWRKVRRKIKVLWEVKQQWEERVVYGNFRKQTSSGVLLTAQCWWDWSNITWLYGTAWRSWTALFREWGAQSWSASTTTYWTDITYYTIESTRRRTSDDTW